MFTHVRAQNFQGKLRREKRRNENERRARSGAHAFQNDFCSDVRTAATVLEALLCAFRGLSEAFSEATASRFQPLMGIYSLIACKVHAAEFRSLRCFYHPTSAASSGRNSDPLQSNCLHDFPLLSGINLFQASHYLHFHC